MTSQARHLKNGRFVFYDDKTLGHGGMGVVYRGVDNQEKRACAIKTLLIDADGTRLNALARQNDADRLKLKADGLHREATALRDLTAFNPQSLPKFIDYFEEDGIPYLVMELIEGMTLLDWLESKPDNRFTETEVLGWLGPLLDVLKSIHEQAVIHHDIKPENLILTYEGDRLCLMDLGSAVFRESPWALPAETPHYRSPEQVNKLKNIDHLSDIYSLGATLYTLLTGHQPTETAERMNQVELPSPRSLQPSISPEMESVILKALELDPKDRYQSILEMRRDLERHTALTRMTGMRDFETHFRSAKKAYIGKEVPAVKQHLDDLYQAMTGETPVLEQPATGKRSALIGGVIIACLVVGATIGRVASPVVTRDVVIRETVPVVQTVVVKETVTVFNPTPAPAQPAPSTKDAALLLSLAPDVVIELVRIPAGSFSMGSAITDTQAAASEYITQSHANLDTFLISKYEVTSAQYDVFAKSSDPDWDFSTSKNNHPATNMTWDDAVGFCEWLSRITGRKVILPSEAQWEKAARGNDGRRYPWGNQLPDGARADYGKLVDDTTAVDRYSPLGDSSYGVADMAGNAGEWTSSLFRPYPYNANDGREAQDSRDKRVVRGGAFADGPEQIRSAARLALPPENRDPGIGFRIAVMP